MTRSTFDPAGPLPTGLTAIEASAGTGKTYALSALAVRFIAERDLPIGALCIVTFTSAATAELRHRVRTRLVDAVEHLVAGAPRTDDPVLTAISATGNDHTERAKRLARLRTALAEFDAATITTIHGFCSRLLASAGAAAGDAVVSVDDHDVDEAVNDLVIARYGNAEADPDRQIRPQRLIGAVTARLGLPDAAMVRFETADHAPPGIKALQQHRRKRICNEFADLVDEATGLVRARRSKRRSRTFDSLIADARALLRGPSSDAVTAADALRLRYRLVLIDEFQDTDRVQWDIFRSAFVGGEDAPTVVLVGDPKQSIYRFRSAELGAYLAAVGAAGTASTLQTNWRSDRPLLAALEHLFDGFTFGSDAVAFQQVDASPSHQHAGITGVPTSPLQLRWVPCGDRELTVPRARSAVHNDLVGVAVGLLDGSVMIDDGSGGVRPLRSRDIAVLTVSNVEAAQIANALGAAGVAAATSGSNSVLETDARDQWVVLLRALERPASVGAAGAAALGWFVGWSSQRLDEADDERRAALHDLLREWTDVLSRHGVPRLLAVTRRAGLHERLLAHRGGERQLTDLEHIGELLQVATGGGPSSAQAVLAVLHAGAGTDDDITASETLARRIDRDDDAVQVLTVHKAKGLEFPVVLCPSLWTDVASRGVPHAELDGERVIDAAWVAGFETLAWARRASQAAKAEVAAEQRRLLYVALTRARHRCIVWHAACETGRGGVLGELLAHAAGLDASPTEVVSLDSFVARSGDNVEVALVDPGPPRHVTSNDGVDAPELAVAHARPSPARAWRIWSFSAIKSAGDPHEHPSNPWLRGGADEPAPDGPDGPDESGPPATLPGPLATAPGGTEFGTMVHEILELCDFTSLTLAAELSELASARLAHRSFQISPGDLAAGLVEAIEAPLGGPAGPLRLRDLARHDRLDELAFDLPLGSLRAAQIAGVLAEQLAADDPFRPWAERMSVTGPDIDLAGMLTGTIDLVARLDPTGRVVVADYKTNQLGRTRTYDVPAMVAAMEAHQYPLQAALYLVAVHRYLRWRQPDYDIDVHLCGAAYLFLRGMRSGFTGVSGATGTMGAGASTPGVMWWHPASAAIEALDRLLAGGDRS